MNTKFYEVDLLQKYRQSISKRYRGYNRVYQVNIIKLQEEQTLNNDSQVQSVCKQDKKSKSPLIQIAKHCFSQSNYKESFVPNSMIIRSTNAQLNLKQQKIETLLNNKKYQKKKFIRPDNLEEQNFKISQQSIDKNQNFSEQYLQNRFKFRKRLVKDPKITQQRQNLIKNIQMIKYQPFSPIIKGQKKGASFPSNNKKTKTTENQTLTNYDEYNYVKRESRNATDMQRQENIKIKNFLKRTNSNISRKSETASIQQSLSSSVEPNKFVKKFSSNFQFKNQLSEKAPAPKVSFPKITSEKQSSRQMGGFSALNELQKGNQKYKKIPLLLKYQFDVKSIDSQSYIVMDAESQLILHGFRNNSPYQIASLTKIMNLYVVLKLIEEHQVDIKQQKIEVEHLSSNIGGTSADLFPGQIYTLQNLLYGLMLPSGNDAALTLAAWGGKYTASNPQDTEQCITQFIKIMNKTAKQLNLFDTRFGNPHGLPHSNSRSTSFDVAKLCCIGLKNQIFKKVVSTKTYKCVANTKDGKKRLNQWQNTNKLLRRQGFIGLKTGITITAGPCLASAFNFKGRTFITVILRAKKISRRFKQTRKILHWCLTKIYGQQLSNDQNIILKKLKRNNVEIDSDYSDEQSVFSYDMKNGKEFRKRCDIISQM